MNILCVDPSARRYGWVVMCDGKLTAFGDIRSTPKDSDSEVIKRISSKLTQLITSYGIELVVAETPIGSQNASASKWLAAVWAVTITVAMLNNVKWHGITASDVKKSLGFVHKEEVTMHFSLLYPKVAEIATQKTREAVADSLAVYHSWLISK